MTVSLKIQSSQRSFFLANSEGLQFPARETWVAIKVVTIGRLRAWAHGALTGKSNAHNPISRKIIQLEGCGLQHLHLGSMPFDRKVERVSRNHPRVALNSDPRYDHLYPKPAY